MLRFFKTLWLLTKLGIFVGLALFLFYQPGTTNLSFAGYELSAPTGVLLVAVLVVLLALTTLFGWIAAIGRLPGYFKRRRQVRQNKKGLDALASGFGALAAGDGKRAGKWAVQAKDLLANDGAALSTMLEGLAAKQSGDSAVAERAFSSLLSSKDTMSFGLRGLLSMAGEDGQTQRALVLAREAMRQKHADQGGLAQLIYTLALREKDWAQAEDALQTMFKAGVTERSKMRTEQSALKLARAYTVAEPRAAMLVAKSALELNPDSIAAALLLVKHALTLDEVRLAQRTIEQIWPRAPHPELAAAWAELMARKGITKAAARIAWVESLVRMNSRSTYSHLALAQEYLNQKLVGQARHALADASKICFTRRVAQLQASIGDDETALSARTTAVSVQDALAARDYEGWICTITGRTFDAWQPVVWPDGLVGTITFREDTRDIAPLDDAKTAPLAALKPGVLNGF